MQNKVKFCTTKLTIKILEMIAFLKNIQLKSNKKNVRQTSQLLHLLTAKINEQGED